MSDASVQSPEPDSVGARSLQHRRGVNAELGLNQRVRSFYDGLVVLAVPIMGTVSGPVRQPFSRTLARSSARFAGASYYEYESF
jgi:hypothetical protein